MLTAHRDAPDTSTCPPSMNAQNTTRKKAARTWTSGTLSDGLSRTFFASCATGDDQTRLRAPLFLDGKKVTNQDKSHDRRRLTQCPTMMQTEKGTRCRQRVCMGSRGSLGKSEAIRPWDLFWLLPGPERRGRAAILGRSRGGLPVQAEPRLRHTHQAVTDRLWEAREALKPQVGARKATSGRSTDLRPRFAANHPKHPGVSPPIWVALPTPGASSRAQ